MEKSFLLNEGGCRDIKISASSGSGKEIAGLLKKTEEYDDKKSQKLRMCGF